MGIVGDKGPKGDEAIAKFVAMAIFTQPFLPYPPANRHGAPRLAWAAPHMFFGESDAVQPIKWHGGPAKAGQPCATESTCGVEPCPENNVHSPYWPHVDVLAEPYPSAASPSLLRCGCGCGCGCIIHACREMEAL